MFQDKDHTILLSIFIVMLCVPAIAFAVPKEYYRRITVNFDFTSPDGFRKNVIGQTDEDIKTFDRIKKMEASSNYTVREKILTLMEILETTDCSNVATAVLFRLGKKGKKAAFILPKLSQYVSCDDETIRAQLALTLGDITGHYFPFELAILANDSNDKVASNAFYSMIRFNFELLSVLPMLSKERLNRTFSNQNLFFYKIYVLISNLGLNLAGYQQNIYFDYFKLAGQEWESILNKKK